jgi:hypothetical protein
VNLCYAKTNIAPCNCPSSPCLELEGCMTALEVVRILLLAFDDLSWKDVHFCSNSCTALSWICKESSNLILYVRHRVSQIHNFMMAIRWHKGKSCQPCQLRRQPGHDSVTIISAGTVQNSSSCRKSSGQSRNNFWKQNLLGLATNSTLPAQDPTLIQILITTTLSLPSPSRSSLRRLTLPQLTLSCPRDATATDSTRKQLHLCNWRGKLSL